MKEKEKKGGEQEVKVTSSASGASKAVFASETQPEIGKIELMNFFFDDEEQEG